MRHKLRKRLMVKINRIIFGCPKRNGICENLSQVPEGEVVCITCNNNHKTIERGLYTGVHIRVMRNEPEEPNLVVAVGDARYVLDKRIAEHIRVKKTGS